MRRPLLGQVYKYAGPQLISSLVTSAFLSSRPPVRVHSEIFATFLSKVVKWNSGRVYQHIRLLFSPASICTFNYHLYTNQPSSRPSQFVSHHYLEHRSGLYKQLAAFFSLCQGLPIDYYYYYYRFFTCSQSKSPRAR